MIIDVNEIESGKSIQCDLCIIGAGAAGITLAREFDDSGLNVWLLESGGFDFEQDTQDLYKGTSTGRNYYPLDRTRLRYLGGTTNHWTGVCRPLDEIDFEKRDWIKHSGWPFDKKHLLPWYKKAQIVCQLDDFIYDVSHWLPQDQQPSPFIKGNIKAIASQHSPPTRFGKVYRQQIQASCNITCCLHANVTHLQVNKTASRLQRLRIETLDGILINIQPQFTVLAGGSIENVRLLLASNDIEPMGLGNSHDLVGRFFMEHLVLTGGGALLTTKGRLPSYWYHPQYRSRRRSPTPTLLLDNELQSREETGNYSAILHSPKRNRAVRSMRYLETSMRKGREIDDLWEHLGNIIVDIDDVASNLYYRSTDNSKEPIEPVLYQQWEQVPNPDSRIVLSSERDRLGLPRVTLDWRLSEIDRHTLVAGQQAMAREVGQLGIGRLRIDTEATEAMPDAVHGGYHQLGMTRMHEFPDRGVVNADCRLHSIDNLYIAGGSVFPTAGSSNPTLTVVALALRLADHLKEKLQ